MAHAAKPMLVELGANASEMRLQVVLDNMPGALVYTDARLNVVFCNERFKDMYPAPSELLAPGSPYPEFLRFLADNRLRCRRCARASSRHAAQVGDGVPEQLERLAEGLSAHGEGRSGDVPAGTREACDEADSNGIANID